MAFTYRVTWFFSGFEQGWSEAFALQRDAANLAAVSNACADAYVKRSRLLAHGYQLVGQRVALVLDNANAKVRRVSDLSEARQSGVASWPAATPNLALLAEWQTADAGRTKAQYIRGIPVGIMNDGKAYNPSYASWLTNWNAWTSAMVALRAGWLGSVPALNWTLTNWATNATTGITTFTVPAEEPLWPTATGFPFRVTIKIPGASSLDGVHVVVPATDTTVYTSRPLPAAPHVVGQVGVMTYRAPAFYTLNAVDAQATGTINPKRIISRDTGRPTIAGRGRRAAIVRF